MTPLGALTARLGPSATFVVAVMAAVLAALVVVMFVSRSSSDTYEMRAVFADVRGLIPGAEVRAGAVQVGTVTAVELNDDDQPEVTFAVDDDVKLHEGAIADIRLGSNVGVVNRTIELETGDPTRPELERGTMLSGDATDQPVNFDEAAEALDPATRANLKRVLVQLDAAFAGRGKDIDRGLRHSAVATNEMANLLAQAGADGEALRSAVSGSRRVVAALAASPADLANAADRTAALLATTGARPGELAAAVRSLGPALAGTRRALDELRIAAPDLRALVAELEPVVDELGPLVAILPEAADAAAPVLTEARMLIEDGRRDLERLRPVIDAAQPVTTKLDPIIRDALPLAQLLRVYTPEAMGAVQNFGAMQGAYDGVGHLWNNRVMLAQQGPPPATRSELAPDECGPGALEQPYVRAPGALECDPWTNYRESYIYPSDAGEAP